MWTVKEHNVTLPEGLTLKEDEDCLYLMRGEDILETFGVNTKPEDIEDVAWMFAV